MAALSVIDLTQPYVSLVDNADGDLRPDQGVSVMIETESKVCVVIPSDAVYRTQSMALVMVETSAGYFEPRNVAIALESDDRVLLHHGVDAGELELLMN